MSETSGSPPHGGQQRYSLFHGSDAAEAGLKAWHAPYADAFRGCDEVLDLGCGPGYFLDLLRERTIRGVGIDIDPAMVAAARRRGHDARVGDQTAVATYRAALGGIHLSHVIEHLWGDDAVALLEASFAALRHGGVLIVRTPNWSNATVRHGGFWMDHTHKRPYPLELLTKIVSDIGFEAVRSGYEQQGWEDTYLIVRKPAHVARRFRIDWHGDFLGDGSLARVNRNLVRAVAARGDAEIVPFGEPSDQVSALLGLAPPHGLREGPSGDLPRIVLRHRWPPRFMNPHDARYVHIQPWEFGSPPRVWVEHLARRADDVWCYSNHVRDGYVAAGIAPEHAHVVPLGFDPSIYHPGITAIPTDNPDACIFLFVGSLVDRKGVAKVVEAYTAAFAPTDPVALLIKHDSLGMYDDSRMADELRSYEHRTDVPPIRFIEAYVADDQMARFYRTATALVHAYRGEGFGLPVLEAMACGVPVVVSGGGSTDDFVDDTVGYIIPAARVPLGRNVGDLELTGEGWWLDPSTEGLVAIMRRIASDRAEARTKGTAAAGRAHGAWTWTHAAQHLVQRVDALLESEPRPASTADRDEIDAYAWWGYSNNGEDGMLVEIFSRLGVVDPFFVELGAQTGVEGHARLMAQRFGWAGVIIARDAEHDEQLRASYTDFPKVRIGHASVTPENIIGRFGHERIAGEFDLLSIAVDGNGADLWQALTGYRPRVVVIETAPGTSLASHAALGERLGYALLTTGTTAPKAIFLRRDLLEKIGFPARTTT